ncbi:competence transcription factor (CTF) [Sporolactobacillus sp. THM7-7]|nr:competence transcription factor (CTF) [Sporolactobacillus sp. THM7-7]
MNEKLEQYIIHPGTMALLPHDDENGNLWTFALEEKQTRTVKKTPLRIVQESCAYFGSTYKGRKKGAVSMGFKSMPPICICSELKIYFISLMSETHRECVWLAHSHIRQWEENDRSKVWVKLTNDKRISIPVAKHSFSNKVFRTAQYRYQLRERVNAFQYAQTDLGSSEKNNAEHLVINERGTYSISE